MPDGICPFAEFIPGVVSFQAGGLDRVGFCDHTASGFYGTLKDPSFWNGQGTSVHFGISRGGDICQLVNIFDTAFAQGRLSAQVDWPHFVAMGSASPNLYLISTEHEDAISLNGQTQFIPGSEWTAAQYAADLRVKRWCIEEVRRVRNQDMMRFGFDSLTGHHMFDNVNRRECPGRFWRDEYRGRLLADLLQQQDQPVGAPTRAQQMEAAIAAAHFARMGFNYATLSDDDKAALRQIVAEMGH